jgi:hypothetical protein
MVARQALYHLGHISSLILISLNRFIAVWYDSVFHAHHFLYGPRLSCDSKMS